MRYVYDLCLGGNTYYDGLHDAYVAFTKAKICHYGDNRTWSCGRGVLTHVMRLLLV